MKFVYRLISEFFLLISPIIILFRILKKKESKNRFLERYAFSSVKRKKGKLIWFHCSSVGELLSIIPLVEKLELNHKIKQILITTTTLSSSKIFLNLRLKKTIHQFFPIDNIIIINKFLKYWQPSIFFLCESEIWPNLIHSIKKNKIKLVLINGRMTLKSFKKWKKIKYYAKEIFNKFDLCFAQNKETHKRLIELGVKKIIEIGNLKFTTSQKSKTDFLKNKTINFFKRKRLLITAASTHFNEESFVIENHLKFKRNNKEKNLVSIIVPRHVERIHQIKNDIEKNSLKMHLHSSNNPISVDTDIYIVDTYGELNKFYKISNIVFMGGSLIMHGGQNPLEPAKLGCKIIHGPHISNFEEIYKKLKLMNISKVFKSHNQGHNIIYKLLKKKRLSFENRKLMNYGQKILNLTYVKILQLI
mgnify:CR=1 FL=1|tara:strand:- start:7225 stop:8475 length:1251 start_codon:yes stop_codon:yes gene_type:complete